MLRSAFLRLYPLGIVWNSSDMLCGTDHNDMEDNSPQWVRLNTTQWLTIDSATADNEKSNDNMYGNFAIALERVPGQFTYFPVSR